MFLLLQLSGSWGSSCVPPHLWAPSVCHHTCGLQLCATMPDIFPIFSLVSFSLRLFHLCLQGRCCNICFSHHLSSPFPLFQSSLFQNICSCFVDMMSPKDFFVSFKILLIPYMNCTFFPHIIFLLMHKGCTLASWHVCGQRTTGQRHVFPSTMQILGISLRTGLPSTRPAMPRPKPQVVLCSWHTWGWGV